MEKRYNWINLYRILDFIFYNKDKIQILHIRTHDFKHFNFKKIEVFILIQKYRFEIMLQFCMDNLKLECIMIKSFYGIQCKIQLMYCNAGLMGINDLLMFSSTKNFIDYLYDIYPIVKKYKIQGCSEYKFKI